MQKLSSVLEVPRLAPSPALAVTALLATALLATACAPKNQGNGAMATARLAASETKIAQLEERLASLEEKASRLDGVAEGVQLLLEKLDQIGGQPAPQARKRPSSTAIYSVPIDGDPYEGPEFAKVTIVKGYDFYCGYCDRVRSTLDDLRTLYGDDIKIVYKNLVIHEEYARLPALAACAAHRQGKFMPMFEQIWVKGMRAKTELTEPSLIAIAKSLKLNQKRFVADMHGDCEPKVQRDFEVLSAFSTATPSFFINGRYLAGAQPITKFRRIIDQELAKANEKVGAGVKLKDYYRGVVEAGRKTL